MRVVLVIAAVCLAACTGTITDETGGTGDGGAIGRADAGADCSAAGSCPCSSNYDCPATFYCHAEAENRVYCLAGGRGAGALGAPCTGERDCKSGICNTPSTGSAVCSDVCTTNECAGSVLPNCRQLNVSPPIKICLAN